MIVATFSCFLLLLLLLLLRWQAATPKIEPLPKMIVATFSSCFLLLLLLILLLLLQWQAATPKIEPLPAANPHGSEGRKSIKIAPKNCLM